MNAACVWLVCPEAATVKSCSYLSIEGRRCEQRVAWLAGSSITAGGSGKAETRASYALIKACLSADRTSNTRAANIDISLVRNVQPDDFTR